MTTYQVLDIIEKQFEKLGVSTYIHLGSMLSIDFENGQEFRVHVEENKED